LFVGDALGKSIPAIPQVLDVFVQKRSQLLSQRHGLGFSLASSRESAQLEYSIFEGHLPTTRSRMPERLMPFTTMADVIKQREVPMKGLRTMHVRMLERGQNSHMASRNFNVFVKKRSQLRMSDTTSSSLR